MHFYSIHLYLSANVIRAMKPRRGRWAGARNSQDRVRNAHTHTHTHTKGLVARSAGKSRL